MNNNPLYGLVRGLSQLVSAEKQLTSRTQLAVNKYHENVTWKKFNVTL